MMYFNEKNIYNIIHHKNIGIEIICYNGLRRVFYHDLDGESRYLFNLVSAKMNEWVGSNLNYIFRIIFCLYKQNILYNYILM